MIFIPHRKHIYGTPLPITWITLLFYMQMIFISHRKQACGSPQPVTGDSFTFFIYVYDVCISQETYLWASTACYRLALLFICRWCSYLTGNTPKGLHGLLLGCFYFCYSYCQKSLPWLQWNGGSHMVGGHLHEEWSSGYAGRCPGKLDDNPWPESRDLDDCSEETHLWTAYESRNRETQKRNVRSVLCWRYTP
jgi:hypothetical protein